MAAEGKLVKVVLIGNTGCGKTCIVTRFTNNTYDETVKNTVGAAFNAKTVRTPDGDMLKFQIWDTAGQERFKNLTKMYASTLPPVRSGSAA
jgi:Ras-related protein Rab-1A